MIKLFLICFGCCGGSPKKAKNVEQKKQPQLSVQLNVSKIEEDPNKENVVEQTIQPIVVIIPENSEDIKKLDLTQPRDLEDINELDLTQSHDLTESGENIRQDSPMTENFSEEDMFKKMKIGDNLPTIIVVDPNRPENIVVNNGNIDSSLPVTIIKDIPNSRRGVQLVLNSGDRIAQIKLENKNIREVTPPLPVYKSVQEFSKKKRFSIKLPRKSSSMKSIPKRKPSMDSSIHIPKEFSAQRFFLDNGFSNARIIDEYIYCEHGPGRLVDVDLNEGTCVREENNGERNSLSIETLKCCIYELSSTEGCIHEESNNE